MKYSLEYSLFVEIMKYLDKVTKCQQNGSTSKNYIPPV